jgi:hypothetical protein
MLDLQQAGNDQRVGIAVAQRALGDDEAALDSLEQALEEGAFGLENLKCDPLWDGLRSNPRFQAILRKMNLVE